MAETAINEIVTFLKNGLLAHGINVQSIALFGSGLSGTIAPGSDLDLIIISDDFKNKDLFERSGMTMKPEVAALKKFMVPMDILNMTLEEYNNAVLNKYYMTKIVE